MGRGGTGADKAHNAGTINERGKWDVHLSQARLDIRRGLWEAITQLGHLVEIVEEPANTWFVGVQFHPEFKSRPNRPHPLFVGFVQASLDRQG